MYIAKKLLAISVLIVVTSSLFAQTGKLPPFQMVQANGQVFKARDLPMGKPIVIIYFSPECDHCEKMTKELIKKEASFKNASVAMITHLAVDKVATYAKQYNLTRVQNFYVGTEGSTFFIRNYYKIEHMPFIALHDKNGTVVTVYRKEGPLTDLVNQLNKLR